MKKIAKNSLAIILLCFFVPSYFVYGAISCSITTQAGCSGVVLLRMSASSNAHAELPSESTAVYDNNVVCCTGSSYLSNSCSNNNKETFAKLSSVTNAHVELPTQSNYANNACLSSTYAGDIITVGYKSSDCNGYDTTLFSMASTPTNSQVGAPSSYINKICAKVETQSITFNISDNVVGFGNLVSTGLRYATGDGSGSGVETETFNMTASTNASSGYGVYVYGDSLKNGVTTITPIGGTNITPSVGTQSFGIRLTASGGVGQVVSPYDGTGFAYDATSSSPDVVADASSGDGDNTIYSVRMVSTIDSLLDPGNYNTNLTYIVVANY